MTESQQFFSSRLRSTKKICANFYRMKGKYAPSVIHFKNQVDFTSGNAFVIVKLIGRNHIELSAFFKLRYDKVLNELTVADPCVEAMYNAVIGKVSFCGLDVTLRRSVLIAV